MEKECRNCGIVKDISEYYGGKDCKECVKAKSKKRYAENIKDPKWVEKERARHREKYHRLEYKNKQKEWDKEKVWKNTSTYKNLHRDLKIPKGISAHHWNYFKLKDIVLMDNDEHKAFHQLIELDIKKRVFKIKKTGEYLDTRNKHLCFIATSGFGFVEYNKDVCYSLNLIQKAREELSFILESHEVPCEDVKFEKHEAISFINDNYKDGKYKDLILKEVENYFN